MKHSSKFRRSRGLTLIELLISMVIGLVVVGAVIVSMIGSGKAGRFQEAYSQMNEDAQIALSIISRDIQMAGYSNPTGLVNITPLTATPTMVLAFANLSPGNPVFGCDTGFANSSAAANSLVCGTATNAAIEVVYEADGRNTVPASGVPSDCLGNGLAGAAPFIARNRYFLTTSSASGASGRPELSCASSTAGNGSQPLVENIENMRISYGVSLPAPAPPNLPVPAQVVRYVSATQITTAGVTEWANVVSVRVCLLVRSAERVLTTGGAEDTLTYMDCAGASQTSSDGYLRRAYFSTAALRDKMP